MATRTRKLDKSEWQTYFDELSKHLSLKTVSILVEGLDLGVQPEADRLVLRGITYDHADDALEFATDELVHRVAHPRDLFVQEDDRGLVSMKVTDDQGHDRIVQLESALLQPERTELGA